MGLGGMHSPPPQKKKKFLNGAIDRCTLECHLNIIMTEIFSERATFCMQKIIKTITYAAKGVPNIFS